MISSFHIAIVMKPIEGTFIENCLAYGCGVLDVGRCRIGTDTMTTWTTKTGKSCFGQVIQSGEDKCPTTQHNGRFPANVVLETGEVEGEFPETQGSYAIRHRRPEGGQDYPGASSWNMVKKPQNDLGYGDSGSASRFFKKVSYTDDD